MASGGEKSRSPPPSIELIRALRGRDATCCTYRTFVLIINFNAYASYHASRKPNSIVKSVLDPDNTSNNLPNGISDHSQSWLLNIIFVKNPTNSIKEAYSSSKGWAPFNGKDGTALLGEIDVAFLSVHAMGMYFVGHLGDRVDLQVFLTVGMVCSGLFVALFGMGYFWNIHNFYYYLIMQMVAGMFQATGWHSVVAVVGNWFRKRKRGLIMGIWNAHTSIGNICGSLIAAGVLQYGWGWSFILPSAFIASTGIIVFLFLVVTPEDIGLLSTYDPRRKKKQVVTEDVEVGPTGKMAIGIEVDTENGEGPKTEGGEGPKTEDQMNETDSTASNAVGFIEAWMIPGVAPFALCLFFAKLVAYTFLYWLPFYISNTAIGGEYLYVASSGNLSTLFDLGGVVGGILAGRMSDRLDARAITVASFMYCAIPTLILYRVYGADLGTHSSLKGNSRALATVTAIKDGTGSVGAALGPLLTGFISTDGWNGVFIMLTLSSLIFGLLSRMVVAEIVEKIAKAKERSRQQEIAGSIIQPLLIERH